MVLNILKSYSSINNLVLQLFLVLLHGKYRWLNCLLLFLPLTTEACKSLKDPPMCERRSVALTTETEPQGPCATAMWIRHDQQ